MSDKNWTVEKGMVEFIQCAQKNIKPIDELAYNTIMNIVDMMVISLARGYHVDANVDANVDKDGKENEIDSIMNQIKKGTDK